MTAGNGETAAMGTGGGAAYAPDSELRAFLGIFWARKWYVLVIMAVVATSAGYYSYQQKPKYRSSAEVLVTPVNLSTTPTSGNDFVDITTEQQVAESLAVAQLARQKLQTANAATTISVSNPDKTNTLLFESSSNRPQAAQVTAQAYADAYLQFRKQEFLDNLQAATQPIQTRLDEVNTQIKTAQDQLAASTDVAQRTILQVQLSDLASQRTALLEQLSQLVTPAAVSGGELLAPALLPASPYSPNHKKTLELALIAGLLLGIGAAFLRDRLDTRVRNKEEVEDELSAPVWAMIPRLSPDRRRWRRKSSRESVDVEGIEAVAGEAYRNLRATLMFAASKRRVKTVMITSPNPGEGKTTTTANLGLALAHSEQEVVIISGDLRRPALGDFFCIEGVSGLTDVLWGHATPLEALQLAEPHLMVMTSRPHFQASELLGSNAMKRLLDELRETADLVLIDCAPVLSVSDAVALAPLVDAVLIVVDAGHSSRSALRETKYRLDQVGARVIGTVLSKVPRKDLAEDSIYHYRRRPRGENRVVNLVAESDPLGTTRSPANGHAPESTFAQET